MISKIISKIIKKIVKQKNVFKNIGINVDIHKSNVFVSPENISIGNDIYIGFEGLFIGHGGIRIDDGTILGHRVEIMTRNHNYDGEDLKSLPYDKKYIHKPVHIKENVWIGSNVKIVPGVSIGEGAVVGMGAVVTKDIPDYSVVGGNPARVIKYRNIEKYKDLKNSDRIYMKIKSHN